MIKDRLPKATLRKHMKAARLALTPQQQEVASQELSLMLELKILAMLKVRPEFVPIIAAYWPVNSELDPLFACQNLAAKGRQIGLPQVPNKGRVLTFAHWQAGDTMSHDIKQGKQAIPQPRQSAKRLLPSIILVPFVAVNSQKYRLGYGGGYYDATLEALRSQSNPPLAIGIGYDFQQSDDFLTEAHDQPLDEVVLLPT